MPFSFAISLDRAMLFFSPLALLGCRKQSLLGSVKITFLFTMKEAIVEMFVKLLLMYCFMLSKLEAGQVKLQSRLEEEEQAKAALMGRIQRLTKLILVSTKNSMQSSLPDTTGQRRRHSFGEDEVLDFSF